MSRFRRLGLAAAAAVAALALAGPPSASAISINGSSGPWYTVSGSGPGWTYFVFERPDPTELRASVRCGNSDNGMPIDYHQGWGHGWGLADGQARTLFSPAFQQPNAAGEWGCQFVDRNGALSPVSIPVSGALALELTGLATGENPSSPRRKYNGRLFFYDQGFRMSFVPQKYPGCVVAIAGPQSADLLPGRIVVDDNTDKIDMDVSGVSFAVTKTPACPWGIEDSVRITQAYSGWRLNNVTVTP